MQIFLRLCYICLVNLAFSVDLTPTNDKAEDLSQYDPGCGMGSKSVTLTP